MTTTMAIPERSLDQRMAALARANAIRSERTRYKRTLKAMGRAEAVASLGGIVLAPPIWAETWKLREALKALPKMGTVAANPIIVGARASDAKTLGGLSVRQRYEVTAALEVWSWGSNYARCPECAGRKAASAVRCLGCWVRASA